MLGGLNYLWGNIAAIDILNIARNEGSAYSKDIDLCFAGKPIAKVIGET